MTTGNILAGAALAALVAAGCGNDQPFPVGPTTNSAVATNSSGGQTSNQAVGRPTVAHGTVTALSGSCPALTITIGSTIVTTTGTTIFPDGACSIVAVGSRIEVAGLPQSDGSIAATRVLVAPPAPTPPSRVHGVVASLAGTCPAVTFTLGQTTVSTTAATTFQGGGCSAIANGSRVSVEGQTQADGSIVADRLIIVQFGR